MFQRSFGILFAVCVNASIAHSQQGALGTGTVNDPVQVQLGSTPVPNPTVLTTDAINALRTEMAKLWEQRFADIVKQIDRISALQDAQPATIRTEIANLDRLMNEKFKGLSDQQVQRDNNLALALTAQQKSVADQNLSNNTAADKAERNFKDQIAATQSTITDLKDRITRIESGSAGSGSAINWVIAAAGFVSVIVSIGVALFAVFKAPVPVPLPVVQYSESTNGRRKP